MIRIKRLMKSFKYAQKGFIKTWREEQNLQIQSIVAVFVLFLSYYFNLNRMEWIVIILLIGLVMLMELANSAVERIADVLKPRINSYVKEIKDISAAAVMISSLIAAIVGIIIFWPHFFN
jgi:diacylglycerol kinase